VRLNKEKNLYHQHLWLRMLLWLEMLAMAQNSGPFLLVNQLLQGLVLTIHSPLIWSMFPFPFFVNFSNLIRIFVSMLESSVFSVNAIVCFVMEDIYVTVLEVTWDMHLHFLVSSAGLSRVTEALQARRGETPTPFIFPGETI